MIQLQKTFITPIPTICLLYHYADTELHPRSSSWFIVNTLCELYATSEELSTGFIAWTIGVLAAAIGCFPKHDPLSDIFCQRALLCALLIGNTGVYELRFGLTLNWFYEYTLGVEMVAEQRMIILRTLCFLAGRYLYDSSHRAGLQQPDDITKFSRLLDDCYSTSLREEQPVDVQPPEAADLAKALDDAWAQLPHRAPSSLETYLLDNQIISARLAADFRRLVTLSGYTPEDLSDSNEPRDVRDPLLVDPTASPRTPRMQGQVPAVESSALSTDPASITCLLPEIALSIGN